MKTAELIKLLQEADPTGNEECCVGNSPIIHVSNLPSYYDGCKQTLVKDEQGKIIAAKYSTAGRKISLYCMSIVDVLLDDPHLQIDYSELETDQYKKRYQEYIEKERAFVINLDQEIELGYFIKYVECRFNSAGEYDGAAIKQLATNFFHANLSSYDLIPNDLNIGRLSYNERRHQQWDREISGDITRGELWMNK